MGGKVVHIVKTQSIYPRFFGKKEAVYEAVWADVEDFQCILISKLMWQDHVPDTVKKALHSCCPDLAPPHANGKPAEEAAPEGGTKVNASRENLASSRRTLDKPEDEVQLLADDQEDESSVSPASEPEANVEIKVQDSVQSEAEVKVDTEVKVEAEVKVDAEAKIEADVKNEADTKIEAQETVKNDIDVVQVHHPAVVVVSPVVTPSDTEDKQLGENA